MALALPNAFYAPGVLAAQHAPDRAHGHGHDALPSVTTAYGARAWRSPFTFVTAPRLLAGQEAAVWSGILDAAATRPGLLRLERLPFDAASYRPFVEASEALGLARAVVRAFERPMLDAGQTFDGLEARWSRGRRRNLRRAQAELSGLGGVRLDCATRPLAVQRAFATFCAIEHSGWKGRAGTALEQHEADRRAFGEALRALATQDNCRIHTLLVDGRPIASGIVLLDAPHAFYAKIAYDEAFARASPGTVLSVGVTRELLSDPTVSLADSCATEGNAMIAWMWPDRRPLADVLVATRPATPPFAVEGAARLFQAAHEAREGVKRVLGRR